MTANYNTSDPTFGTVDLDDRYVTDPWLIDQFVGNQFWTWGRNAYGQLGLNDTTDRSSPVQVGALTNWRQITGGYNYTSAIKTDGTLWTWGRNAYGQLGLGDSTNRSSPVQVGSLTNWRQVANGFNHPLAIQDGYF